MKGRGEVEDMGILLIFYQFILLLTEHPEGELLVELAAGGGEPVNLLDLEEAQDDGQQIKVEFLNARGHHNQ